MIISFWANPKWLGQLTQSPGPGQALNSLPMGGWGIITPYGLWRVALA